MLLGLGWNFGFIGATAMLASSYTPAERGRVQGMNDFAVFGLVCVASLASGGLMNCTGGDPVAGWTAVNLAMVPLLVAAGAALVWLALILLGLGWNFGFIGATAMVAATYRPSEKARVQGFHDLILFSSTAFASLMAGAAYNYGGWDLLNWVVFPVCILCLAALGWLALHVRNMARIEAAP